MTRLTKAVLGTLMAAVILLSLYAISVQSAPRFTVALDVQDRLVHRGGVIRVGSMATRDEVAYDAATIKVANTGIYLHDNSSHASAGITGLQMNSACDLIILTDDTSAEEIMNVIIEEDETLTALQVVGGGSGGSGQVRVPFRKNGVHVCANSFASGTANIWVSITHLQDVP